MHSTVLLAEENTKFQVANEKETKKRQVKRKHISKQSSITAREGKQHVEGIIKRGRRKKQVVQVEEQDLEIASRGS
jgi:hypothetical protein